MLSIQALGLPGRLTIRVFLRITETARLSMARHVTAMLAARMASAIPGTVFSATSRVASGVMSRGAKPVPPVVRIRSGRR